MDVIYIMKSRYFCGNLYEIMGITELRFFILNLQSLVSHSGLVVYGQELEKLDFNISWLTCQRKKNLNLKSQL